jgi:hypothetical protein
MVGYMRSAHGVLAVYDVTDPASLTALEEQFLPELSRYAQWHRYVHAVCTACVVHVA